MAQETRLDKNGIRKADSSAALVHSEAISAVLLNGEKASDYIKRQFGLLPDTQETREGNFTAVAGTLHKVDARTTTTSDITTPVSPVDKQRFTIRDKFGKFADGTIRLVYGSEKIMYLEEEYIMNVNYLDYTFEYDAAENSWVVVR